MSDLELQEPPVPATPGRRGSSRRILLVVAAGLVVVLAAVATIAARSNHARVDTGPRSPATTVPAEPSPPGVDPHETEGRAEAEALMSAAPVDPGWTEAPTAAAPILSHPPETPSSPNLIDIPKFFTTPASWTDVDAWLAAHPPPGLQSSGTGSSGDRTGPTSRTLTYAVAPLPPTDEHFQVVAVTTAPLAAGGTGIRIDAAVIWIPTRSPDDMVPSTVDTAVVTASIGNTVPPTRLAERTVGDHGEVMALASLVDHLQPDVGGTRNCPADFGLRFTVTFTGPNGTPSVTVVSGNCGTSSFTAGHRPALVLGTGALLDTEAELLGTTLDALDADAAQHAFHPVPNRPAPPTTR